MKKLFIYRILGLLLLFPLVSGCNDSDDLQAIFIGKVWKLSYINTKDNPGMMNGFDEKSLKILSETKDSYTLSFLGTEDNNTISGTVSGKVITANIKGNWSANGKDNQFRMNIENINEPDGLAKEFIRGLNSVSSYSGDNKNLYIYYQPSGSQQTFVLTFHVK